MKFIDIPLDRQIEARRIVQRFDKTDPELLPQIVQDLADRYFAVEGANGVYTETEGYERIPELNVGLKVEFKKYGRREVAQTFVKSAIYPVTSTNIYVGGYGMNQPLYASNLFPGSSLGQRWVLLNQLGAGTEQFARSNLSAFPASDGSAPIANLDTYNEYTAMQLNDLIDRYYKEGKPVAVSGMSLGGYTVMSSLVDPELISNEVLSKIDAVFLDAPVPLGPAKFGLGSHLMNMARICLFNGYPQGVLGASGEITPGIIEKMMISDSSVPKEVSRRIASQCFKATGVFPEIAFSTEKDRLKTLHIDNPERAQILRDIPIRYHIRPQDHTVNNHRLLADVNKYYDLGYDVDVYQSKVRERSHVHLPLLNLGETLFEYYR